MRCHKCADNILGTYARDPKEPQKVFHVQCWRDKLREQASVAEITAEAMLPVEPREAFDLETYPEHFNRR